MKPTSDYNLRTISTVEYEQVLSSAIESGGNCFVVGRRGSGKSVIALDAVKKSDCDLLFLNLSTLERVDMAGFPDLTAISRKDDYVRYILPLVFKPLIEGDRPVVAVLDEVDKADKELHAPILEFLQNKSINGRPFKNLRAILMTGNLPAEGGRRPILPLLDRTEKYLLEATAKHWLEWGGSVGGIHPSCLAFIADNPNELCGEVNTGENYGSQSPRMWEGVSKMNQFGEAHNWNPSIITLKAYGFLGKTTGIKYQSYFEHYQVLLPYVDAILKGEKVKEFFSSEMHPGKKITAVLILCNRVASILDKLADSGKKEIPVAVKNAGKFLLGIDREMAMLGIRNGIGQRRTAKYLFSVKEYDIILEDIARQLEKGKA